MLERGGNAVDAALAAAAVQTVVEPVMNGLGGDLFALVWDGTALRGLNASGRAPRGWSQDRFAGRTAMPELGWDAVTVPGAVSGWAALRRRFGTQPFADLLAPAVRYAREGFPVTPQVAGLWAQAPERFAGFAEFARVFLPGGRAPAAGTWLTLPDLAGSPGGDRGDDGRVVLHAARSPHGSPRRPAPAVAPGRGGSGDPPGPSGSIPWGWMCWACALHELPPNGPGLAALLALGILGHCRWRACARSTPTASTCRSRP